MAARGPAVALPCFVALAICRSFVVCKMGRVTSSPGPRLHHRWPPGSFLLLPQDCVQAAQRTQEGGRQQVSPASLDCGHSVRHAGSSSSNQKEEEEEEEGWLSGAGVLRSRGLWTCPGV